MSIMAPRILRIFLLWLVVVAVTTMPLASASASAGVVDEEDAQSPPASKSKAIPIVDDADGAIGSSCDDGGGLVESSSGNSECVDRAAGGEGGGGGGGDATTVTSASASGTADIVVEESQPKLEKSDNDTPRPRQRNPPINVLVRNDSPHRIDVHYDDGRFGKVVGSADAGGGVLNMSTFVTHSFFVTMHGAREGLVDPSTDEQYSFDAWRDGQLFVVPDDAAPSTTACKDRYPVCTKEADNGECTRNPGWMIVNCCRSCDDKEGYGHLVDADVRCSRERLNSTVPAWRSGSLDDLFARWATDERYEQYKPKAISSPGRVHGAEHDGPWVFVFDDFVSDFEVGQLLEGAAHGGGFERSTDQGQAVGGSGEVVKVTSSTRTSSNAWCRNRCEELPGVKSVTERIEEVSGARWTPPLTYCLSVPLFQRLLPYIMEVESKKNQSPSAPRSFGWPRR